MNLEDYKFAKELRKTGRSKRTIEEYVRRLNNFITFYYSHNKNASIFDVQKDDILKYYDALKGSDRSNRTVNAMITTLSVFYRLATQLGKVKFNPVPNGLHIRVPVPDTPRMSDNQLENLKSWFNTLQPNLRAAFWCMYGSGCRVGEVAHLKYSDVIVKNGAIYLNIKDAKWASDRLIPIMVQNAAQIVYEFKQTERPSNDPLFHITRRTLQDYAKKFAEMTGFTFHCHMLRHNYATRLCEKGFPLTKIQRLLGHRSIVMTMHYTRHAKQGPINNVPKIIPSATAHGKGEAA